MHAPYQTYLDFFTVIRLGASKCTVMELNDNICELAVTCKRRMKVREKIMPPSYDGDKVIQERRSSRMTDLQSKYEKDTTIFVIEAGWRDCSPKSESQVFWRVI